VNLRTARAKLAALVVLFFLGTFAGQIQHLLDSVRGKVERGAEITGEIRSTVSTIGQVVDDAQGDDNSTVDALRAQIGELQGKLSAGTATPSQVSQLQGLVERLRTVAGTKGPPGPPGAAGSPGPPGPAAAPTAGATTSSTGPGGTTSSTRPPTSTTTTTTRPTTTTTRPCNPVLALLGRC
jgi:hypothetical protein